MTGSLVLLGLCQTKCSFPGIPITLVNLCIVISVVAIGLLTLARAYLNWRTVRQEGPPAETSSRSADDAVGAGEVLNGVEYEERQRWK